MLPVRHWSLRRITEEINSKVSQAGHSPLIELDGFVLKKEYIVSLRTVVKKNVLLHIKPHQDKYLTEAIISCE